MPRRIDAPFRAFETGPHVVPAPTAVSHGVPVVEILRHAAAIHQRVDRARSADHATARPVHAAAVQPRIGLRLILPIDRSVGEGAAVADGGLDPEPVIAAAGFEYEYAVASARREPLGEHAARGARADDDVVELIHAASLTGAPGLAMPFRDPPMIFFEMPWRQVRRETGANPVW